MEAINLPCSTCKNYLRISGACPAFPGVEIPDDIWSGENPHTEPTAEQKNKIVYEAGEPQLK